jgi:membrane-associated phospholipid phosphatase
VDVPRSSRARRSGSVVAAACAAIALLALSRPAASDPADRAPADSATLATRARAAAHATWGDVATLLTSPARMKRSDVLWTAGLAAATVIVLSEDQAIRDAALRSRGNGFYDGVVDVGEALEPWVRAQNVLAFWAAGAAVSAAIPGGGVRGFFLDGLESHLFDVAAVGVTKVVTARDGPDSGDPHRFFKGGDSFPSAHTSVAFELATFVTGRLSARPMAYRVPVAAAAYGLAGCVGVQRVDSGEHWASDVVAGAICGTLMTHYVVGRNDARRAALTPVMGARGTPVGVTLAWRF